MNENQPPFRLVEQTIPFGERLVNATQNFFYLLALAPICLITAPINFFRILFTTKRKVAVLDIPLKQNNQAPHDVEPWKKEHDDLFGSED